ncbi:cobalamin-binding protein, partial [bacterium]|nr:cobalamin-binding protein [bacterium]
MKIVSLLSSATEIVYALDLEKHLVAVTHECDYPPMAADKPVITSSVLHQDERSSLHIHKGITGLVHEGKSIYYLDERLLERLQPDLVLTQELCDVCAVSYDLVVQAARVLSGQTEIISLEPTLLQDIFSNIALVAERTGQTEAGRAL